MTPYDQPLHLLLLGGSGFVGSSLLRLVAAAPAGSVRVRAILRNPDAVPDFPWLEKVRGSLEALPPAGALEPAAPYVLVHFASKQIDRDGTGYLQTNVEGTRALLATLGANLRGVVYSSSMSVYGPGSQDGVTEASLPAPATDLARSRMLAEAAISGFAQAKAISAFLLRPRFVLGAGDAFVLPGLAKLVALRLAVGPGSQRYSVIGVEDYAQIVLSLARHAHARDRARDPLQTALNVGYAEPLTFDEITGALASAMGKSVRRARVRIPVSSGVTRFLRRLPIGAAESVATRLELIGLSHWGDVSALEDAVGDGITGKDPRAILRDAAASFSLAR